MPTSIPPVTPAPSQSTASLTSALARQGAAGPGGALGRDQFLRLLTTQLRYQDPMNPMDGHQLAADLAQFSGLEQLLNINDQLEAQQANADVMLSAVNNTVALGTIGKTVVAAGDSLVLADNGSGTIDGTVIADITASGTATLEILDTSGRVVGQRSLGAVTPGTQQEFAVAEAASGLQAGLYHSRVVVKADDGTLTTETTYFTGRIDGLSYAPDGAVLTSGPVDIPIGSIRRIIG